MKQSIFYFIFAIYFALIQGTQSFAQNAPSDFLSSIPTKDQLKATYQSYQQKISQGAEVSYQQLENFMAGANSGCGDTTFAKANATLCSSIFDDLNKVVYNPIPESAQLAEKALTATDPQLAVQALDAVKAEVDKISSQLTSSCTQPMAAANETLCYNLSHKLEMASGYLDGLVTHIDNFTSLTSECLHQLFDYQKIETITETYEAIVDPPPGSQCTEAMAKRASDECMRDLMCTSAATTVTLLSLLGDAYYGVVGYDAATAPTSKCISSENSCVIQALKGIVDSVWSLVTGVWDLVKMLGGAAWETGKGFYNSVVGVENVTDQSLEAASYMSEESWAKLKSDPAGWVQEQASVLIGGAYSALTNYLSTSLYCQEWSGVVGASTCVRPWTGFACMECGTFISGTCAAIGVLAAELVPMFFTGGLKSFAQWSAKGVVGVAKALGESAKFIELAEKVAPLASGMKKAAEGSEVLQTLSRVSKVSKTYLRYTAAELSKLSEAAKLSAEFVTKSKTFLAAKAIAKAVGELPPISLMRRAGKTIEDINMAAFHAGEGAVDLTYGKAVAKGLHYFEGAAGASGKAVLGTEVVTLITDAKKVGSTEMRFAEHNPHVTVYENADEFKHAGLQQSERVDSLVQGQKFGDGNVEGAYRIDNGREIYGTDYNLVLKEYRGQSLEGLMEIQQGLKAAEAEGKGAKIVDFAIYEDPKYPGRYSMKTVSENVTDISSRGDIVQVVQGNETSELADIGQRLHLSQADEVQLKQQMIMDALNVQIRHPDGHPLNYFTRVREVNGVPKVETLAIDLDTPLRSEEEMLDIYKTGKDKRGSGWGMSFNPENTKGPGAQYNFYFNLDRLCRDLMLSAENCQKVITPDLVLGHQTN